MKATTKPKSKKTTAPAATAASTTRAIRLSLHRPQAHTVCLAGSFNDWQPDHLQSDAEGEWSIELSLPPDDYDAALEKILLEIAQIDRRVRTKS